MNNVRNVSPFYTPCNYSTSLGLCGAVKQYYKVPNPEYWYVANRKHIVDMALPDPFKFAKFETIHDWYSYQVLKNRHEKTDRQ